MSTTLCPPSTLMDMVMALKEYQDDWLNVPVLGVNPPNILDPVVDQKAIVMSF